MAAGVGCLIRGLRRRTPFPPPGRPAGASDAAKPPGSPCQRPRAAWRAANAFLGPIPCPGLRAPHSPSWDLASSQTRNAGTIAKRLCGI
jgi:hypothetical protein